LKATAASRARAALPGEKGLFGKPTLLNKSETSPTYPDNQPRRAATHLRHEKSRGTKVFAWAEDTNTGLVEIPMARVRRS
jgi:NADH:ubiquinone oxidoreductase subunit F (NADH-binding)